MLRTTAVLLFSLFPLLGHAGSIERLKSFMEGSRSAQAEFSQTVMDKNGKKLQSAAGTMQFVRPGKFRWVYQKPYEQVIVGDGAKFWLYDVDLNQVTVKKLDAALGSSPAALLAGNNEIERSFGLKDVGNQAGLDWVEAKPKSRETNFEVILLGFDVQGELAAMELHDNFGHATVLRFSNLKRNPSLAPGLFRFIPPKGADVLGD
ncbi:outer membrane lipoprotein chaperone LolA [Ferriphaselus sp. R-1]|uniref:outer membrane lipoprotein chaperone LolA n=1 Tax=Ferriphaselus sp. R-1 TaxID=1485544 RepID=UPI0005575B4B|nr:outer membrane lipoprotein chaperone LolA [Ferriphaselus sp. R-1]